MAIAFLALNGEGLGHLVRSTVLCELLWQVGERPVIFSQGIFPLDGPSRFAGRKIPSLWRSDHAVKREVAGDIASFVGLSLPAVLIEDTHPSPIVLPRWVRRILIVRPPSFEYASMLHQKYASLYDAFLLADDPGSPTWPYRELETRIVLSWPKWQVIGPIYRRPTPEQIVEVTQRYGLVGVDRTCVFSMGGGGEHTDSRDAEQFTAFSSSVADKILADGMARLIFVKGPYFPDRVPIDSRFEVVQREPLMAALLATADSAVIRVGFNTTWECLSAGTPFLPYVGTTYAEPVHERIQRVKSLDLLPHDVDQWWQDDSWRSHFRAQAVVIARTFSGQPDPKRFGTMVRGMSEPQRSGIRHFRFFAPRPRRARGARRPMFIRIDDVNSEEPALDWLLRFLAKRGHRASLEVVPYLCTLRERDLARFDPRQRLFEVSQHGYAHVPNRAAGRRFEYAPDSAQGEPAELENLVIGQQALRRAFPDRYRGGFSPPFDVLPTWLPRAWAERGGSYISTLRPPVQTDASITIVLAGTDVWDWHRQESRPRNAILTDIESALQEGRPAGLVLHPRCLRERAERARLVGLLELLERSEFEAISLSEFARSQGA